MAEIKKERVAIFIDGSNFYHGLKTCISNTKVDFSKFSQLLCGGRELVRAYYYNAPVNQQAFPNIYKDQQRFFDSLKTVPYFVLKLGRLEKRTIKVDKEKCTNCNLCIKACPTEATKSKVNQQIIAADCFSCARCLRVCPFDAIDYRY